MKFCAALLTMYLRYRLVDELNRDADTRLTKHNRIAFVVAIASTAGLSIVANFQVGMELLEQYSEYLHLKRFS